MQQLENLAYRCVIDEFEHLMYDRKLSRVQLCELWADISNKYTPWNRIPLEDIRQGKCWPRQTHIVERPFYYIQYDIAQIARLMSRMSVLAHSSDEYRHSDMIVERGFGFG